jgi:hypothetical protein
MERREALRWLAAGAGLGLFPSLAPDEILAFGRHVHTKAAPANGAQLRVLDAHANRSVIVVAERIIPTTDTPGATDANVNLFIDHMLAAWYDPRDRDRVLDGIRDLDARSRTRCGQDFAGCSEADQVALLNALDEETSADDHWFSLFKYLTVWGYCTSEVAMRETLRAYPAPFRYDGCAPYQPRTRSGASS